jgi:hypothetical protein
MGLSRLSAADDPDNPLNDGGEIAIPQAIFRM